MKEWVVVVIFEKKKNNKTRYFYAIHECPLKEMIHFYTETKMIGFLPLALTYIFAPWPVCQVHPLASGYTAVTHCTTPKGRCKKETEKKNTFPSLWSVLWVFPRSIRSFEIQTLLHRRHTCITRVSSSVIVCLKKKKTGSNSMIKTLMLFAL